MIDAAGRLVAKEAYFGVWAVASALGLCASDGVTDAVLSEEGEESTLERLVAISNVRCVACRSLH